MVDYLYMLHRHLTAPSRIPRGYTGCFGHGARQTGKSTLVQSPEVIGQDRQYLTFDDPGILAAARRDPNGFVAGLNAPVTLDEVQHVLSSSRDQAVIDRIASRAVSAHRIGECDTPAEAFRISGGTHGSVDSWPFSKARSAASKRTL